MSKLLSKLQAASVTKLASTLADSEIFNSKTQVPTPVPALNIALSGSAVGGLTSGLTILAAPSAHFKTLMGLFMVAAYMKAYPDAVCVFYDSEFGVSTQTFASFGIDPKRVLHIPVATVEQIKFDIVQQLDAIERGDRVIFFVDSVGGLASTKETKDAEEGKSSADMTRAKEIKSLFRLVTAQLTIKDIPMVVINQTYTTLEMYSKQTMAGGTGIRYSGNTILYVSKSHEKDGDELVGYNFKLIVDKSRFVREKSVIPLTVTFDGGIQKWSGMFDLALELGWIDSPSKGWYQLVDKSTGEVLPEKYRAKELRNNGDKFLWMLSRGMGSDIEAKYRLSMEEIFQDEDSLELDQTDGE